MPAQFKEKRAFCLHTEKSDRIVKVNHTVVSEMEFDDTKRPVQEEDINTTEVVPLVSHSTVVLCI